MLDQMVQKNVLGGELKVCCSLPKTGFYRTGKCELSQEDLGGHLVCAELTEEFLLFSKIRGNDLTTTNLEMDFPGLKPGDRWCICLARWLEALQKNVAPPIVLTATHEAVLRIIPLEELQAHACG